MASHAPRDDQESSPLLGHSSTSEYGTVPIHQRVLARLQDAANKPVSLASRILLLFILFLLLLCSIFIGLFVGLESRISHQEPGSIPTVTFTETVSHTSTSTATRSVTRTTTTVTTPTVRPEDLVCTTPECIRVAASILESVDSRIDPCDDFYQFATGGWSAKHILSDKQRSFSRLSELILENHAQLRSALVDQITIDTPNPDGVLLRKLHDFYDSCTQLSELDNLGSTPLLDVVKKTRQLLEGKDTELPRSERLAATLAYMHSIDAPALFQATIRSDAGTNAGFLVPVITPPRVLGDLSDSSLADRYKKSIEQILLEIDDLEDTDTFWPPWPWPPPGGDKENRTTRASRLAGTVLQLEKKIHTAVRNSKVLCEDPLCEYNPVSLSYLSDSSSLLNFTKYVKAHVEGGTLPETVIITHPGYLTEISIIIANATDEVLTAYITTKAALSLASHLSPKTAIWKARDEIARLSGFGSRSANSRPELCSSELEHLLGFATSRIYLNFTLREHAKSQGYAISRNITNAFARAISGSSWMDRHTAEKVIDKVRCKATSVEIGIGYPSIPNAEDSSTIERYYQDLPIDSDTYFENVVQARQHAHRKIWTTVGFYRQKGQWNTSPSGIAPSFEREANQLVVPMTLMKPPFFHADWPRYVTYGSFGTIVAHELLHGFDLIGRSYSGNGTLGNWWSEKALEQVAKKEECLEKQYSSFEVKGVDGYTLYLDGTRTLEENFCDSGVIHAYRAWKSELPGSLERKEELLLPGLNFTREQLFFISYGLQWAQLISREALQEQVERGHYAPNQFRVKGALANVPEFAEAFGCHRSKETKKHSEKVCLLWH